MKLTRTFLFSLFFLFFIWNVNGSCPSYGCGCSWASSSTCQTNDGSQCFEECCCKAGYYTSSGSGSGSGSCPSYSCGCSWASSSTCQTNDGSSCFAECCCKAGYYTPGSGSGSGSSGSGWGTAVTTRYYDCCKPSCAWDSNLPSRFSSASPVRSCTHSGSTANANAVNVCNGGGDTSYPVAYMCVTQNVPRTLSNGIMIAFAASSEECCTCHELEFTSGSVSGERLIVQTTNTGADLGSAHFDLQLPGGGFGIYNGCSGSPPNGAAQFSAPTSAYGARYGGVSSLSACSSLPSSLQAGCQFRFNDFQGADNPNANYRRVQCPSELTSVSGCVPDDDSDYPNAMTSSWSAKQASLRDASIAPDAVSIFAPDDVTPLLSTAMARVWGMMENAIGRLEQDGDPNGWLAPLSELYRRYQGSNPIQILFVPQSPGCESPSIAAYLVQPVTASVDVVVCDHWLQLSHDDRQSGALFQEILRSSVHFNDNTKQTCEGVHLLNEYQRAHSATALRCFVQNM